MRTMLIVANCYFIRRTYDTKSNVTVLNAAVFIGMYLPHYIKQNV